MTSGSVKDLRDIRDALHSEDAAVVTPVHLADIAESIARLYGKLTGDFEAMADKFEELAANLQPNRRPGR